MSDNQKLIQGQNVQYDYPEQNPDYQGDTLDPQIKSGPLNDRGCKDLFWCILYLLMIAGMVLISLFAFQSGNPNLLLAPFDSEGNHCGIDDAYLIYPYVYVTVPNQLFFCVNSCPRTDNETLICKGDFCPQSSYASTKLLTICFPDSNVVQSMKDEFDAVVNLGSTQQMLADLRNSWPVQLITAIVALIISLLVTVMIRYTASCLVWGVIFLYFAGIVLIGFGFYETGTNPDWQNLSGSSNPGLMKDLAYATWGLAALSLVIFVCLVKKITLAIAVMKAAADFTRQVCEASLVPLIMFVVMTLFFAYSIAVFIFLVSTGKIEQSSTNPFGTVTPKEGTGWLLFYDLFALYWNCNFAMAFSQFVISSSCCMWYFSHMGAKLSHPVSKSVWRGLVHHSGSLALGSLILAIVGIIRFCLDQVHKAFKKSTLQNQHGVGEGVTKCFFNYCTCCLACFEKFIRFLNQNAYIMIALSGDSFCVASHQAFYLIMRNAIKVAVTHGVGEVFTVLGNMFIGISSTAIGYTILTQIGHFSDNIVSPIIPTLGFLIISFVIGSLFMNVYGMAVDSILMCYIVDSELNRSNGGAKSVPPSLKEFLNEYK